VPSLTADLEFRGLIHQITDPALLERLDAPGAPIVLYGGFDPTAESLQVGNLMLLCTMRRFQLAGHRVIALVGGVTGFIGDPGGKSSERALQTSEQLAVNVAGIRAQVERFIDDGDPNASKTMLVDNTDWLTEMGLVEFLRDVGKHFTVSQMMAKESVRGRLERDGAGISYTEFSYMLLQAYDFLRLHLDHDCVAQIGGSDQWGNITAGVELVRRVTRHEVFGLTTPLALAGDGTKLGKSEHGTVWLDPDRTSPFRLYQFFINVDDAMAGDYLRYFTFLSHEEILSIEERSGTDPRARLAQRTLAREVCALVHGAEETDRAEGASQALFSEGVAELDERTLLEVFQDAPSSGCAKVAFADDGMALTELLVQTGLASSISDARRTINQGGLYLNNRRERDQARRVGMADLLHGRYLLVRRGAKTYHLVRVDESSRL
jgi:tyrosyl-tRNA synthetase